MMKVAFSHLPKKETFPQELPWCGLSISQVSLMSRHCDLSGGEMAIRRKTEANQFVPGLKRDGETQSSLQKRCKEETKKLSGGECDDEKQQHELLNQK